MTKTPWHIWVVGGLATLWALTGVFDYIMTVTENEAYLAKMTPEQIAYFSSIPSWFKGVFAVAVWVGLAGSAMILVRRRLAVPLLIISLIAMTAAYINSWIINYDPLVMDTFHKIFSVIIYGVQVFLLIYAIRMSKAGILR